ncbi:MAG TPA: MFS transporter, partial [Savagea sp.]
GMSYSMDNMGRIFGPILYAGLFTTWGGNIYYLSAIIAVLSLVFLFLFQRSNRSLKTVENS